MARYKMKLRLNKRHYLAVLDNALVIVTENEKGEAVRFEIFDMMKDNKKESLAEMYLQKIRELEGGTK